MGKIGTIQLFVSLSFLATILASQGALAQVDVKPDVSAVPDVRTREAVRAAPSTAAASAEASAWKAAASGQVTRGTTPIAPSIIGLVPGQEPKAKTTCVYLSDDALIAAVNSKKSPNNLVSDAEVANLVKKKLLLPGYCDEENPNKAPGIAGFDNPVAVDRAIQVAEDVAVSGCHSTGDKFVPDCLAPALQKELDLDPETAVAEATDIDHVCHLWGDQASTTVH